MTKKQRAWEEREEDGLPLTEYSRKQREKNKDQRIKEQRRSKNERRACANAMFDGMI